MWLFRDPDAKLSPMCSFMLFFLSFVLSFFLSPPVVSWSLFAECGVGCGLACVCHLVFEPHSTA